MASGGNACFELPTTIVEAVDVADNPVSPVFDCAPLVQQPVSGAMLDGHTVDFATRMPMPNIEVQMFEDLALASQVTTFSNEYAEVTAAPSVSLMHWRTLGDDRLPTLDLYKPMLDGFDAFTTTKADITALVTSVSDKFAPGKSQLVTSIRDCNGSRLMNTIINVAPATGRNGSKLFEAGVRTYYFADTGMPARRTQLAQTTRESRALATNLAPGRHLLQLWGFTEQADVLEGSLGLSLLAEVELVLPDGEHAVLVPLTTSR